MQHISQLTSEGHIAIIKLDNPPDNKLLRPDFIDMALLDSFLKNKNLKSVIISGVGRHFSAGADIKVLSIQAENDKLENSLNKGKALLQYLYDLNIPVISAIEGVCFGGGLEIALASHIRVVSEKAILAFPETMHSLMPGLCGTYNLKKFMTLGNSIEMILSAQSFDAPTALEKGLADYICPPKKTFDFAFDLALRLTKDNPHKVINNVMQALKNAYVLSKEEALREETRLFCELAKVMAQK